MLAKLYHPIFHALRFHDSSPISQPTAPRHHTCRFVMTIRYGNLQWIVIALTGRC